MITIMKTVNQDEKTVTLTFSETEAEYDRFGVMCHKVDAEISSSPVLLSYLMRELGFRLVDAEVVHHHLSWPDSTVVEYWASPQ